MNATRLAVLMVAFAVLGLSVVYLRTEQARSAARTLAMEMKWIELRGEWWELQTDVARLRSPERIRDRLGWYQLELKPPGEPTARQPAKLAGGER